MKRLIGVGVGPGDPELVTVKAVRVLREADVVLVPVLAAQEPQEPGRAEAIVRAYVAADRIRRLEFALNDTGGVTPRRAAAWHAAAAAVAEEFASGAATVAFGTLGDPNLYSTFSYLAQTVRDLVPGVTVETVPGITAMQDLASRAGISLAEGTEPVTLLPLNGAPAALDQALAQGGTVVGYKVGAAASPAPALLRARLRPPAASTAPSSAPASAWRRAHRLRRAGPRRRTSRLPYLSTLIVPATRATRGAALAPRCHSGIVSRRTGGIRRGRTRRPRPADRTRRPRHRRSRRRHLGVEPGRPPDTGPRPPGRGDRRLSAQLPHGRRRCPTTQRAARQN